jgi:hypothetical protein
MVLIPIFSLNIIGSLFYIYHIINVYYIKYYIRFSKPQYGELVNSLIILLIQILISANGIYFHKEFKSVFLIILIIWILITNGYINVIKKQEFDYLGFVPNTTINDDKPSNEDEQGLVSLLIDDYFNNSS